MVVACLFVPTPVRAEKTLMFLVDWWNPQGVDTVIGLKVFQPTEVVYLNGGAPPAPKLTTAYTSEARSWWYSLSNFNADDYAQGRIRINTTYQRGFYQYDSTYKVLVDTNLALPDTQKTFTYRSPVSGSDTTVTLGATLPKKVFLPAGATYRGPRLQSSADNSQTDLLNQRNNGAMGNIDKCVDSIPGDTVWIRWGTPASPPGNSPSSAGLKCTSYNPFSTRAALVYLRSPWPGATDPVVEFNGLKVPLYPSSNADWLVADLRYFAYQGTPAATIRFRKSPTSSIYFDSAGVDQPLAKPFVLPNLKGGSFYFVPPEAGAPLTWGASTPPKPLYTIYVQNPWQPGTPRLLWESDANLHVMRPTQNCGWYSYPLYATPTRVLIGHSYEDSVYGSTGVGFRTRTDWINIAPGAINAKNEIWIQTINATGNRIPATPTITPVLKDCSTDTLKLVMQAYDFKGREDVGGNPSFQTGGLADRNGSAGSSGLVKGMVQVNLGANDLPVYTGRDSGYQVGGINGQGKGVATTAPYGVSTPSTWFDTTALRAKIPGISIGHTCLELPLTKTPQDSGYFKYNNQAFFPLDTITDQRGMSMLPDGTNTLHNFLFCLQGHASFEYTPGLNFEFKGDDDVWVFINKKLAVDVGGVHGPESASVSLDKLKLREGGVYPFDIFYCERQTGGSTIRIRTTMDLQPSWKYRGIPSTAGSQISVSIEGQESKNYVASCADFNKSQVAWQKTSGRLVLIGPDGSNLAATYTTDTTLYGGFLSYKLGLVQIDTSNLKLDPGLSWSGLYTVRVESRLGDSLYTVSFTQKTDFVNVDGTVLDRNGDGIADSVRLRAHGSIFSGTPSYHLVWYTAAGIRDSLVLTPAQVRFIDDSTVVAPLSGKAWGERTAIPVGASSSNMGSVLATPAGKAKPVTNPIHLIDGIAPVADSAFIKYDETGTGKDSLFVWSSEPMTRSPTAPAGLASWALVGRSASPRSAPGEAVLVGDNSRFVMVFDPASDPVVAGDSLRLGGWVADALGNSPGVEAKWVPIHSGNPSVRVVVFDRNQDGQADSVVFRLTKSASGIPTPTSFGLRWNGIVKSAPSLTSSADRLTWSGPIGPFPLGTAAGPSDAGWIVVGGSDSTSYLAVAQDSVAPVAVDTAVYHYGQFGNPDTLFVFASEPIVRGTGPLALTKSGEAFGTATDVVAGNSMTILVTPSKWTAADSLRLGSGSRDGLGNSPGANSRLVKIVYGAQPLRVVVWDRDGDGTIDSVAFRLTRSSSGMAAPSGFGLVWAGKPATVGNLAHSADGLSWTGSVTSAAPLSTSNSAGDEGWLVIGTDITSFRANVEDSAAPIAMSARLVYGFDPGSPDTVIVNGSEGLAAAAAGAWLLIGKDTASATPTVLTSAQALNSDPVMNGNSIRLIVASGSIGNDAGWVRFGTAVSDGKTTVGPSSRWVPLVVTPSGRAYLFDSDGDGRADSMRVVVRGTLSKAVSGTLTWGDAAGGVVTKDWNVTPGASSFSVHPASDKWFDKGATSCPGACTVTFRDALGNSLVTWPLLDSVAPMLVSATYTFGETRDTLKAVFSEPLVARSNTSPWIEWGNTSVGGPVVHESVSLSNSGTSAAFVIDPALGASDGWDSLRLAAGVRSGAVSDVGGTITGATSPWAPVAYGIPPMVATLRDPMGEGRGTDIVVHLVRKVPAAAKKPIASFLVAWTNEAGNGYDTQTVAVGNLNSTDSSWSGKLAHPFALGVTGCGNNGCNVVVAEPGSVRRIPLLDGVPPSLVWAKYRYSLPSVALDTITVGLSEPWNGGDQGDPSNAFVLVGNSGKPLALAPWSSWSLSNDHLQLVMDVPATWGTTLRRGDSARLAPDSRVTDSSANRVGSLSRWVPIAFGLRPPQLDVSPWPKAVVNNSSRGGGTPWPEPPPGIPGIELLVRDPANITDTGSLDERLRGWKTVDGAETGNPSVGGAPRNNINQLLGVKIRINRPLQGALIIYDNIGIAVRRIDLDPLKNLWAEGEDQSATRDVWIAWNGTGTDGKFTSTGVYIFRAVVRYQDSEGHQAFQNLVWKLGWHRNTK